MRQRKTRRHAARALNPRRKSQKKQRTDKRPRYRSKNSLTELPDAVSGKNPTRAKVLVVHRIGFVRSGVLSLIAKSTQFAVCGETDAAPLARELFLRYKPQLVVIGLRLSGADGIQLIKEFRNLSPVTAILALSEHADAFSAQRVFRAGARAYLTIEDAPELLRAFDEILAGHPYVGASVLPVILSNFATGSKNSSNSDINTLSDRELEIFSFIGRGVSVSELATELHAPSLVVQPACPRPPSRSDDSGLGSKDPRWLLLLGPCASSPNGNAPEIFPA